MHDSSSCICALILVESYQRYVVSAGSIVLVVHRVQRCGDPFFAITEDPFMPDAIGTVGEDSWLIDGCGLIGLRPNYCHRFGIDGDGESGIMHFVAGRRIKMRAA